MERLAQYQIDDHFFAVQQAVNTKWQELAKEIEFPMYSPGREDHSILEEYERLDKQRRHFFNTDNFFTVSHEHLRSWQFRHPDCLTFSHSATDPSYNSSSITVDEQRFFALEGPQEQHLKHFINLIETWNVNHLVCLTDAKEQEEDKCHPYWHTLITPFEFWPEWLDGTGATADKLIAKAQRVKEHSQEQIIAVHCSAGVGRTGTFIATICLLNQLDNPTLSIYELVLYLNFHRPWMVGNKEQYLSLYRVMDLAQSC